MIYTNLEIPRWLQSGINPSTKGSRLDKIIYGGDTETVHGKPNSLQFFSEDIPCSDIYFVTEQTACKTFIEWCKRRKPKVVHVVYVHFLEFDLVTFLWGHERHRQMAENEFDFEIHGARVRGIYGTPTYCTIRYGHDVCVHLVDSSSFYRGSLSSAAKLYCPHLPKLVRPRDLGVHRYSSKHTVFVEYAMRDAEIAYHIGRAVEDLHTEFDLPQCISIADLAARTFRHCYLNYTIPQPSYDIVAASLDSYHGGKNNLTAESGWYEGVHSIDISSAYPKAMRDMPAFASSKLYKRYRKTRRCSRISQVPDYGVYCLTGRTSNCKWPVIFGHDFAPIRGEFQNVWVQGFEVNEALRSKELKLSSIFGYYYDSEKDHQAPALRGFCDDFYRRKLNETDEVRKHGYKLVINSVSGKLVQTRKRAMRAHVDIDSGRVSTASEMLAGGLFHPFMGSAVTAHTRSRIHHLEHIYSALHTATDGLFTQEKPRQSGYGIVERKATALGSLVLEASGDLLLIRNKCYILYSDDGKTKSRAFPGRRIRKYAKHGFQGSVFQLEKLIATGKRKYKKVRANRLKESIRRGLAPNDFVERVYELKVPPLKLRNRHLVQLKR